MIVVVTVADVVDDDREDVAEVVEDDSAVNDGCSCTRS